MMPWSMPIVIAIAAYQDAPEVIKLIIPNSVARPQQPPKPNPKNSTRQSSFESFCIGEILGVVKVMLRIGYDFRMEHEHEHEYE